MLVRYPANFKNVSGSTKMPVCAENKAHRDTRSLPPPVKVGKVSLLVSV